MLAQVAALPAFSPVSYLDLRTTLPAGPNYEEWWDGPCDGRRTLDLLLTATREESGPFAQRAVLRSGTRYGGV